MPVLTHWTSHHACFTRLLEIEGSLRSLAYHRQADLVDVAGAQADEKKKAKAVLKIASDGEFWEGIKSVISVLRPLAVAANVAQDNSTRLDQVFLLFGRLFQEYTVLRDESEIDNDPVHQAATKALASLKKRWAAADPEIFIAAAILNPFFGRHRLGLSELASSLAGKGLFSVVSRLYARVFCEGKSSDVPGGLFDAFDEYQAAKGRFSDKTLEIKERLRQSKVKNQLPDPLMVWALCKTCPLCKLAEHIFSVAPNTAANERVFSAWALIHTKQRNRYGFERVMNIASLREHWLREHKATRPARSAEPRPGVPSHPFLSARTAAALLQDLCINEDDVVHDNLTAEVIARAMFCRDLDAEEARYVENDARTSR